METPHQRSLARPYDDRRQRMLALIVAAAGLLLGGLAGSAFAQNDDDSPSASAVVATESPDATASPAAAPVADTAGSRPVPTDWSTESADPAALSLTPLLFKVSLGLGLVVLLAWGTVYLLRRTTLGQGMASNGSVVRVVDRNWLGPKKAIYLVDISGRTLALGVTEENISVLSSWEEGEIDVARPEPAQGGFADQFRTMLKRRDLATAGGQA